MNTARLTSEEVLNYWPTLEPQIAKALKHSEGESSTFDIFHWLMNPEYAQCWVVFDGDIPINVTVTKVNRYAQHTSLHLVTTTGDGWDSYKNAHAALEDYARDIGANRIEWYGRKGWQRIIDKLEGQRGEKYHQSYVVYSMEVNHEDV